MKKLIYLFLSLPILSLAQQSNDVVNITPKNEIGIEFMNVSHLDIWKSGKTWSATSTFRNPVGLMYTRHFGKNAVRVTADYFVHAIDINNDADYHYYFRQSGTERNAGLSIGYERTFSFGRFNIDPFADFVYRNSFTSGRETAYGCFIYEDDVYFKREDDIFGGRAGINFKYQLNRFITLSAACSYNIDKTFHHDLLAATTYSQYRRQHFDPLDHIGIAFCF